MQKKLGVAIAAALLVSAGFILRESIEPAQAATAPAPVVTTTASTGQVMHIDCGPTASFNVTFTPRP